MMQSFRDNLLKKNIIRNQSTSFSVHKHLFMLKDLNCFSFCTSHVGTVTLQSLRVFSKSLFKEHTDVI